MDLSYILNSPDVERIASALETISDNTVEAITDKLDKNQGSAYAGKAMVVGSDGNIIPSDAVSDRIKAALLACFEHVVWNTSDGMNYYSALVKALNVTEITLFDWDYTKGDLTNFNFTINGQATMGNDGLLLDLFCSYIRDFNTDVSLDTEIMEFEFIPIDYVNPTTSSKSESDGIRFEMGSLWTVINSLGAFVFNSADQSDYSKFQPIGTLNKNQKYVIKYELDNKTGLANIYLNGELKISDFQLVSGYDTNTRHVRIINTTGDSTFKLISVIYKEEG